MNKPITTVQRSNKITITIMNMGWKFGRLRPLLGRRAGSPAWAEAYLHTKWHLNPRSHLDTTDMGQKLGGSTPFWGGGWVPIWNNVARAEAYLHAKFHLDPFNRLATVHQRYSHNRTDNVLTGRTVLQTVAQKPQLRILSLTHKIFIAFTDSRYVQFSQESIYIKGYRTPLSPRRPLIGSSRDYVWIR